MAGYGPPQDEWDRSDVKYDVFRGGVVIAILIGLGIFGFSLVRGLVWLGQELLP